MKDIFTELLERTQERFTGRDIVLQLASEDVSDYERGKVQGQIEMLTYLMMELAGKDDEVSSV